MKIIYTDITQDLSQSLLDAIKPDLEKGKKIYYIVPSSMSFEREKQLLERLSRQNEMALFDLIVTRFKQLPYYFDLRGQSGDKPVLSKAGMGMLFKHVLLTLPQDSIPLYKGLVQAQGFLEELINLRQELQEGNLTLADLPDSPKNQQLQQIMTAFDQQLNDKFDNQNHLTHLITGINQGQFSQQLAQSVFVIDGYTRFSAEEFALVTSLHQAQAQVIIGTHASSSEFNKAELSVYSEGIALINKLSQHFQAQVIVADKQDEHPIWSDLTAFWSAEIDFTNPYKPQETIPIAEHLSVWSSEDTQVEIEQTAIAIKQLVAKQARYKDITVLVGDISAYQGQICQLFDLYDIPYFYANEQAMQAHPLIILLESLVAIQQNNYRTQDILTLLKTGLYEHDELVATYINHLDYYLQQYQISGKKAYRMPFQQPEVLSQEVAEQADPLAVGQLELIRQYLLGEHAPLQQLFASNEPLSAKTLVTRLQTFLETGGVLAQFNQLYQEFEQADDHLRMDQYQQVWQLLLQLFETFMVMFDETPMTMVAFLKLLVDGMKTTVYRQVPANVDVVIIKDYELVTPSTSDYVFALGLTRSNLPRRKQVPSLITEKERLTVNENPDIQGYLDLPGQSQYSRSNFVILSLLNASNKQLVLSAPQITNNEQADFSELLERLVTHYGPSIYRHLSSDLLKQTIRIVGNERGLIRSLSRIENRLLTSDSDELTDQFWLALFRRVRKANPKFDQALSGLSETIEPSLLSPDVLHELLGTGLVHASVSAFEKFYQCEYQYFLGNQLKLKPFERLDIDAKHIGEYFHTIFELVMDKTTTSANFDSALEQAIQTANQRYAKFFSQSALSNWTYKRLSEVIKQTATILKTTVANQGIQVDKRELAFGFKQEEPMGDKIAIRGKIDRVDHFFDQMIGAVDYKSGAKAFKLHEAYYGESLQFLSYLDIIKRHYPDDQLWGALYLQFQNPTIKWQDLTGLDDMDQQLHDTMQYQGMMVDEAAAITEDWQDIKVSKTNRYSDQELAAMLEHNRMLYEQAADKLVTGHISINPTKDKQQVRGCAYCPFKSICRFEADKHSDMTRSVAVTDHKTLLAALMKGED